VKDILILKNSNFIKQEMIVRFVDIGKIDDHHCLNFLFIRERKN